MWQRTKNIFHLFQAISANIYFGLPGRKLIIIGVTGTDGKTTTVNIIYHILKTAGKHVSIVSTTGATIHGKESHLAFHVTNPASWPLQKFLHEAAKSNYRENYIVLEVSSHGIDQNRIWGIPFTVGIVTNITPEHLDYHKTYDEYLRTKTKLLKSAKITIVNKDDNSYKKIMHILKDKSVITYGMGSDVDVNEMIFPYQSPLIGDFNRYNILAAISACKSLGLTDAEIAKGIKTFTTPLGRMNKISNKRGIDIIVDYAHTANGIKQALTALKQQSKGKLIAIIGGEGYRDEKKRPIIGEVATTLANYVIITAVDPRGLQDEINKEILRGVKKAGGKIGKNIFVIDDRKEAIDFAINSLAKKGDTVSMFGKGHERSMNIDGKHEIPWSEYEAVASALKSAK